VGLPVRPLRYHYRPRFRYHYRPRFQPNSPPTFACERRRTKGSKRLASARKWLASDSKGSLPASDQAGLELLARGNPENQLLSCDTDPSTTPSTTASCPLEEAPRKTTSGLQTAAGHYTSAPTLLSARHYYHLVHTSKLHTYRWVRDPVKNLFLTTCAVRDCDARPSTVTQVT
jgi:hypothetical protein